MSNTILLEGIELIPVLELTPSKFATQTRESPSGSSWEVPDDWSRYWSDCLTDSGITSLRPLRSGSWHVPTVNFDVPSNLHRFLEMTFHNWGGIDCLSDPDCNAVLNGGLALLCPASDVLIEPGCCSDLGDANNWKLAAEYRGAEWQMLWIGHPWLSFRYQTPWLILSGPHESNVPSDRWGISPAELNKAISDAMAELTRFAEEIARHLPVMGYRDAPETMGRKLVGLCERVETSTRQSD